MYCSSLDKRLYPIFSTLAYSFKVLSIISFIFPSDSLILLMSDFPIQPLFNCPGKINIDCSVTFIYINWNLSRFDYVWSIPRSKYLISAVLIYNRNFVNRIPNLYLNTLIFSSEVNSKEYVLFIIVLFIHFLNLFLIAFKII